MARTLTAKRARTILWGKLGWHPAVNAWIAFADGAGMPDTIEVLRDGKQTATYRLVGAGPNGELVIAQRVRAAWAVGRTLYERVLRHLPLTTPRYYGSRQESCECVWLFFQDAYSRGVAQPDCHVWRAVRRQVRAAVPEPASRDAARQRGRARGAWQLHPGARHPEREPHRNHRFGRVPRGRPEPGCRLVHRVRPTAGPHSTALARGPGRRRKRVPPRLPRLESAARRPAPAFLPDAGLSVP